MSETTNTPPTETHQTPHDTHALAGGLLTRPRWNPYVVGIAIGVLSWLVFSVVN